MDKKAVCPACGANITFGSVLRRIVRPLRCASCHTKLRARLPFAWTLVEGFFIAAGAWLVVSAVVVWGNERPLQSIALALGGGVLWILGEVAVSWAITSRGEMRAVSG